MKLKKFNQSFDEQNLLESGFVSPTSEAIIIRIGLIDGKYHWRARTIDDKGNASQWQEFGIAGDIDFEVKLVPLYTQVESDYPSRSETIRWFDDKYGPVGINYNCFDSLLGYSSIRSCGCAITSMVMLGRYYNINIGIDNSSVDPGNINNWFTNNSGYTNTGKLFWDKAIDYLGYIDQTTGKKMVRFDFDFQTDWNVVSTSSRIDDFVNFAKPAVVYNDKFGHYFIADGKLAATYTIKDPAKYNTKTLNDDENPDNKIRDYNNYFATANLFTYLETPKLSSASMYIALASPAELLITDSQGRKLGKDPTTNTFYDEIPRAKYGQEGPILTSDITLDPNQIHKTKVIYISEPINGQYQLQVIGTGEGDYSLESAFFDTQGNINQQEFQSETALGYTAQYNLFTNSENSASTTIELFDETPPEAKIYFNSETQELEIKGIDNMTVNPIVSIIEQNNKKKDEDDEDKHKEKENIIYQIRDEAGNTTKLFFKKIKQEGKKIRAELEGIQYNNGGIIEFKAEFKYEWSLNQDNTIKELEQKIKVEDQFRIKTKYSSKKDETKIEIKTEEGKEKQILPGLVIIKLTTELGVLVLIFKN